MGDDNATPTLPAGEIASAAERAAGSVAKVADAVTTFLAAAQARGITITVFGIPIRITLTPAAA